MAVNYMCDKCRKDVTLETFYQLEVTKRVRKKYHFVKGERVVEDDSTHSWTTLPDIIICQPCYFKMDWRPVEDKYFKE